MAVLAKALEASRERRGKRSAAMLMLLILEMSLLLCNTTSAWQRGSSAFTLKIGSAKILLQAGELRKGRSVVV